MMIKRKPCRHGEPVCIVCAVELEEKVKRMYFDKGMSMSMIFNFLKPDITAKRINEIIKNDGRKLRASGMKPFKII